MKTYILEFVLYVQTPLDFLIYSLPGPRENNFNDLACFYGKPLLSKNCSGSCIIISVPPSRSVIGRFSPVSLIGCRKNLHIWSYPRRLLQWYFKCSCKCFLGSKSRLLTSLRRVISYKKPKSSQFSITPVSIQKNFKSSADIQKIISIL